MYELNSFFQDLNIDRNLVTDFFIVFSRFEYALKKTKYIKADRSGNAEPNWNSFIKDNKAHFESIEKSEELQRAIDYLKKYPPKKQVYKKISDGDETQKFFLADITPEKQEMKYLFTIIKVVRNNLFHGGKYPFSSLKEPARNTDLLRNSLIVLEVWLKLNKEVKILFFNRLN